MHADERVSGFGETGDAVADVWVRRRVAVAAEGHLRGHGVECVGGGLVGIGV
ncbi:hypothetical protein [Propioniciclava flava]